MGDGSSHPPAQMSDSDFKQPPRHREARSDAAIHLCRYAGIHGIAPLRCAMTDDDTEYALAFSRRIAPEFCRKFFALSIQRAQGMPDARCTRGLVCELCIESCTRAYRAAEASDIPCAMALRLMTCSPRWAVLVVSVARGSLASRQLDASIRGVRTTRLLPYAFAALVRQQHRRPPHPRPTFVTMPTPL